MSPFDPSNLEDPRTLGLMQLALGLMKAGGPSRMPQSFLSNFGTAGEGAIGQMQQARQLQLHQQQVEQQARLQGAQLENLGLEGQQRRRDLAAPGQQQEAWESAFGGQPAPSASPMAPPAALPNPLSIAQGQPQVPMSPLDPAKTMPVVEAPGASVPPTMDPENWFKYSEKLLKKGLGKEAEAAAQKGVAVMGATADKVKVTTLGDELIVTDKNGVELRRIKGVNAGKGQQAQAAEALYQSYLGPPYNMQPEEARLKANASAYNLIRFIPDAQGGYRTVYEPEAMNTVTPKPGAQSSARPNPYAPAQQGSGQIGGSQGSKGTEKLYEDTQQMSTAIDKKGIAGVDIGMRSVAAKLKEYQNRPDDLPGIGYLKNLQAQGSLGSLANFMLTDEGKDLKSSVQTVMNTVMHSEIGSQQTVQESVRQMQAILQNPTASAHDFYNGWANLTKKINATKANIISGFAPEVHQEYGRRSQTLKSQGYESMDLSPIPVIDAGKPIKGGIGSDAGNIPLTKPYTPSGKAAGWSLEEEKRFQELEKREQERVK